MYFYTGTLWAKIVNKAPIHFLGWGRIWYLYLYKNLLYLPEMSGGTKIYCIGI